MEDLMKRLFYIICIVALAGCAKRTAEDVCPDRESLQIANDLSNQKVSSFAEDINGHVWIGTFRGLNRHNVHEYHQYFCTDEECSLPDNQVQCMLRDSKGRLWISTVNGMALYTDKDDFVRIPMETQSRNSVQILEDNAGRIFINTAVSLCEYNEERGVFEERMLLVGQDAPPVSACFITPDNDLILAGALSLRRYDLTTMQLEHTVSLEGFPTYFGMTPEGIIWMSSHSCICLYDTNTSSFIGVPSVFKTHPIFSEAVVTYAHFSSARVIYLNTEKHGLFVYDSEENTLKHQSENGFPFQVPDVKITCMYTDTRGNLWIGTYDQGYHVVYSYQERFNNDGWLKLSLGKKSVISVDCDSQDNLWISTLMDGLYRYNLKEQMFDKIDLAGVFPNGENTDSDLFMVFVDAADKVWITGGGGVVRCVYRNGRLSADGFWPIFFPLSFSQDGAGRVWIGTLGEHLVYISPEDDQLHNLKAVSSHFTFTPYILPLDGGNVLSASFQHGFCEADGERGHVRQISVDDSMWKDCISRSVFVPSCMYQDSVGDIWVGTIANGLMRYNMESGVLAHISGTPCLDIASIEEDLQGNLWVSTQYGLGKYDRSSEKFVNWYAGDGIGGNQFYDRASCRMTDGTLVFGGTHGLTVFNPLDVTSHREVSLCFEDLKIHNELVRPRPGGCVDKALVYNPQIVLEHDQNSFSISFAAIDYSEFDRLDYFYMLEGFDDHWIDAHNNREAYYSNVPAGKYRFKVRVSDNGQSKVMAENEIRIKVKPPVWLSFWAILIYLAALAGVVILAVKARQQIMLEKADKLKAQQEKEQERKVNRMNLDFFANISHEFRTPLTMISGPVTQLQESPDMTEENKRLLNIVQRNIRRMLRLVNQQLDFNKLENDTLKLRVKPIEVIEQLVNLTDIFRVTAEEKGVVFRTYGLEDSMTVWADDDKLDKICFNLLSNAMKFTQAGGKVEFSLDVISREETSHLFELSDKDVDSRYLKIVVKDSGPGIPGDKLEKIFERYYQLENTAGGQYSWGTGIGLYFARALAVLHHGYLKAGNRTTGPGATFTLVLPVSEMSYAEAEKDHMGAELNSPYKVRSVKYTGRPAELPCEDRKKVLVVDDDADVIYYMKELLSPYYDVLSRFDAESAYVVMKEEAPDILVSDVAMPGKSGYELCRQIKENIQLSHVPVILLTAKATVGDQVQGLDCGADAYVTKPFEPQYLLALIQSQLKNKEKIRAILSKVTDVEELEEDALSPQDSAFMNELYQLMENELSNSELDVSRMTELLHISRTKFYYKVKGLTGENPSVFFKKYKLNRAAQLLKERKYNISEIADMTGFSTLSHFSTSFKKQFGVSPSEYVK